MNKANLTGCLFTNEARSSMIIKTTIEHFAVEKCILFADDAVTFLNHKRIPQNRTICPSDNVNVLLEAIDTINRQIVVKIEKRQATIFVTQFFFAWWKTGKSITRVPFLRADGSFWTMIASQKRVFQKIFREWFVSLEELALSLFNGSHLEKFLITKPFWPDVYHTTEDVFLFDYEDVNLRLRVLIASDDIVKWRSRSKLHHMTSEGHCIPLHRENDGTTSIFCPENVRVFGIFEVMKKLMEGCQLARWTFRGYQRCQLEVSMSDLC